MAARSSRRGPVRSLLPLADGGDRRRITSLSVSGATVTENHGGREHVPAPLPECPVILLDAGGPGGCCEAARDRLPGEDLPGQ